MLFFLITCCHKHHTASVLLLKSFLFGNFPLYDYKVTQRYSLRLSPISQGLRELKTMQRGLILSTFIERYCEMHKQTV